MDQVFDVAIIGGGINGCGCAADAALRGLSVVLCEQDDLASKTSSKSSKLIHGGLRYLEQFDFSLVRKALNERQKLLQLAPHLVHPLSFVLPYQKKMRPLWMLRAGLFLYDHLSFANKLPHCKFIHRKQPSQYFDPLDKKLQHGFLFYDGATDDVRLTLANALQAKEHGAFILPRTKLINAKTEHQQWKLTLEGKSSNTFEITAKVVINTTGPWVGNVSELLNIPMAHEMSLVKGSHLVVPKLYEGEHAYMLQNDDHRVIFAVPYHGCTMIGTTDVPYSGQLDDLQIDDTEIDYLFSATNRYFNKQLQKSDILNSWSGIRPLLANDEKTASTLSRDYLYHYSSLPAPAVTVYGGKITTYRQLAEQAINELRAIYPDLPHSVTDVTPLPGAMFNKMDFGHYQAYARQKYHWLDDSTVEHYLSSYGTRTETLLADCHTTDDLGICFGPTLYQVEVDYLIKEEWAVSCDDILWRRTKLGLTMGEKHREALESYIPVIFQNAGFDQ